MSDLIERLMDQRYCGQEPMRAEAAARIAELEELNGRLTEGWSAQATRAEAAEFRVAELEAERDAMRFIANAIRALAKPPEKADK